MKLARLARSNELAVVRVPDGADEAIRDPSASLQNLSACNKSFSAASEKFGRGFETLHQPAALVS
jgi:hypothetical protein